jgi:hypothetical protein
VNGFAFGQERWVCAFFGFAQDAVGEFEHRAAQQGGAGFDENLVVVEGGRAIAAGGLDHRQDAAVFFF